MKSVPGAVATGSASAMIKIDLELRGRYRSRY